MSATTGHDLKTIGQSAAAQANADWSHIIRPVFDTWLDAREQSGSPEFVMEEFRSHCDGLGRHMLPSSSNAWGAFATSMQREGRIEWTGRYALAKSPATRCHPVRIYRRGIC